MRKLTITVSDEVYRGLYAKIGRRRISRFLNDLARPHLIDEDIAAGYRAMANDKARETQATDWGESLGGETLDETW